MTFWCGMSCELWTERICKIVVVLRKVLQYCEPVQAPDRVYKIQGWTIAKYCGSSMCPCWSSNGPGFRTLLTTYIHANVVWRACGQTLTPLRRIPMHIFMKHIPRQTEGLVLHLHSKSFWTKLGVGIVLEFVRCFHKTSSYCRTFRTNSNVWLKLVLIESGCNTFWYEYLHISKGINKQKTYMIEDIAAEAKGWALESVHGFGTRSK